MERAFLAKNHSFGDVHTQIAMGYLEEMYAGNYDMTQRIKRIKTELQLAQTELASATNTVEFDYIPLSSSIIDDADIKRIINEYSKTRTIFG